METWNEPHGPHEGKQAREDCPLPATHDKIEEVHYFLHRLLDEIHHPAEFRWNLNGFLQGCRSVLYLSRTELKDLPDFEVWWQKANAALHRSPTVKKVIDSRNFIVHERMLDQWSEVQTGVFRDRRLKIGFGGNPPNDWYSENLLRFVAHVWTGVYLDKRHSSFGEQFGVRRSWRIPELGEGDVAERCVEAHSLLSEFVLAAHHFAGTDMLPLAEPEWLHDRGSYDVLLETDLDPTLVKKWRWDEAAKIYQEWLSLRK